MVIQGILMETSICAVCVMIHKVGERLCLLACFVFQHHAETVLLQPCRADFGDTCQQYPSCPPHHSLTFCQRILADTCNHQQRLPTALCSLPLPCSEDKKHPDR